MNTNITGEIITTESIQIDSVNYVQTILIHNYQDKTIQNIDFQTNNGTISKVLSSSVINITNKSENGFTISKVYPQSNLTITMQLHRELKNNKIPMVIPMNHKEFALNLKKSEESIPEIKIRWAEIIINCVVVSLIFAFFMHYFEERNKRISNELKEVENKRKELGNELKNSSDKAEQRNSVAHAEIKKVEKRLQEVKEFWMKIRLLLMKQVRDLKNENAFYRSLLLNVIKNSEIKSNNKELQDIVRNTLKTYSANIDVEKELDTVEIITSIINKNNIE
jgi:hypothetical protein